MVHSLAGRARASKQRTRCPSGSAPASPRGSLGPRRGGSPPGESKLAPAARSTRARPLAWSRSGWARNSCWPGRLPCSRAGQEETSGQDHARHSGARRVLSFPGDSSDPDGMRKQPSTWSIVWTDSACYQITSIAAVVFVVALLIKLTGTLPGGRGKPDVPVDPEFANLILAYAVAGILFLSAIVALRVARIRSLFDRGLEIEATVRKVKRYRGGTTLKLELQHAGITYRVSTTFQRWWRTPSFEEGRRISVLVDPLNPRRAIPLALYAEPGADPRGAPAGTAEGAVPAELPGVALRESKSWVLRLRSGSSRIARSRDDR